MEFTQRRDVSTSLDEVGSVNSVLCVLDYAISDSDDPAADGFQAGNHAQQR